MHVLDKIGEKMTAIIKGCVCSPISGSLLLARAILMKADRAKFSLRTLPFVGRFALGYWAFRDPNAPVSQIVDRGIKGTVGFAHRHGLVLSRKHSGDDREKVVVLGTGWASLYFLHQIRPDRFKVTVISPRDFFVFTPLLTSALSGTLSLRSVMEPIRNKLFWGGKKAMDFYEATADDVDLEKVGHINTVGTLPQWAH